MKSTDICKWKMSISLCPVRGVSNDLSAHPATADPAAPEAQVVHQLHMRKEAV